MIKLSGIEEFLHPPADKPFRELIPLKELRKTKEIVQSGLKALGWNCDWISDTDITVEESLKYPVSGIVTHSFI